MTANLTDTTDAMAWANAFCDQFDGQVISSMEPIDVAAVGPGAMVGWFANAIEAARRAGRQETCPHLSNFTTDGTMRCCRTCGKVLP